MDVFGLLLGLVQRELRQVIDHNPHAMLRLDSRCRLLNVTPCKALTEKFSRGGLHLDGRWGAGRTGDVFAQPAILRTDHRRIQRLVGGDTC